MGIVIEGSVNKDIFNRMELYVGGNLSIILAENGGLL